MKKVLLLVAAFVAGISAMQAQNNNGFTFFLGVASPTGEFSYSDVEDGEWALSNDDEKGGGAGLGFDIGLQYNYGIQQVPGLSVIFSADAILNTLNDDIKDFVDDWMDDAEDNDYDDYSFKTPKYYNLPIMAGANYTYKINDMLSVYGEMTMGLCFRKITNMEYHYEYDKTISGVHYDVENTTTLEYDLSTSFAYRLGTGVVLKDKYNIGLSFWNLGAAKVKGKAYYEYQSGTTSMDDDERFSGKKVAPTMYMLRVGFKF